MVVKVLKRWTIQQGFHLFKLMAMMMSNHSLFLPFLFTPHSWCTEWLHFYSLPPSLSVICISFILYYICSQEWGWESCFWMERWFRERERERVSRTFSFGKKFLFLCYNLLPIFLSLSLFYGPVSLSTNDPLKYMCEQSERGEKLCREGREMFEEEYKL